MQTGGKIKRNSKVMFSSKAVTSHQAKHKSCNLFVFKIRHYYIGEF